VLSILRINRQPLEELTGTDLIYFNETFDAFVMVQYKAMETEGDNHVFRLPRTQLESEVAWTDTFATELATGDSTGTARQGFRLNAEPFFLKFCPSIVQEMRTADLVSGMYFPPAHLHRLQSAPLLNGPRGGVALQFSFKLPHTNADRYMTNSDFTTPVRSGWIGTRIEDTTALWRLIAGTLASGRSVTFSHACETPVQQGEPGAEFRGYGARVIQTQRRLRESSQSSGAVRQQCMPETTSLSELWQRSSDARRQSVGGILRLASLAVAQMVVLASAALTVSAQGPARIALPDGRRVEVFGLRRWTIGMVQDSLKKYSPSDSLTSHACAAALRHALGFADAGSWLFVFDGDTASQATVLLREPQDSARVHFRALPVDTVNPRRAWRVATRALETHPAAFRSVMRQRLADTLRRRDPLRDSGDVAAALRLQRFLAAQRGTRARDAALHALSHAPNRDDRSVAALILAGFPESDAVRRGLLDAVRDPDDQVSSVVADAADAMSRLHPRTVDWRPVGSGIRAMLDGTALFRLATVVDVLTRTGVGPRDAALLLRGGGAMLVDVLESDHSFFSSRSRALLTQLAGRDLGPNPGPWRTWIATL
jgi:hypothetical protein